MRVLRGRFGSLFKRRNRPHRRFTQGLRKVKKTSIEDEPEKMCIRGRVRKILRVRRTPDLIFWAL